MIITTFIIATAAAIGIGEAPERAAEAPQVTYESLLNEMIDPSAIARWPSPEYRCVQASSYDRAAKAPDDDWFANSDHGQFLRSETNGDRTEWVMMDAAGPGAVVRIWSANPWDGGTLRVYLDESASPVIETPMEDILGGTWHVGAPLSAVRSRGWNLYLPIPYARQCKITADKRDFYYQINYRTYLNPVDVETFSMEIFRRGRNALRKTIAALQSVGLQAQSSRITEIERTARLAPNATMELELPSGSNAVQEFSVRLTADDLDSATRQLVVRGTFDGHETVWCPIGHFFGTGLGINPYQSWRTTVSAGGVMHATWPMPYESNAKLILENLGDSPVELAAVARVSHWKWDDRSMHLNVTWRSEDPIHTGEKRDWNFVEIEGKGVYAGDVLSVSNPTTAWWGEGDEKIYVDGEAFPSHFGTGTEDYYGYAWCDWHVFDAPFHAQPRVDGPVVLGHTSLLRTRSLDAIPFARSLKFDMEIWHWQPVEMSYAVATFYYAIPGNRDNRLTDRTSDSLSVPKVAPPMKISNALEAEEMEIVSLPADATARIEGNWQNCDWSNDAQMWFGLKRIGDAVELRSNKKFSGPHRLILRASRYPDYAIISTFVNGQQIGQSVDLWQENGLRHTGPLDLGVVELKGEYPIVRFEVVGHHKDAKNAGTYFGIDCIEFQPVKPSS
jgi:D-arabinan exo alpha-(1,3)/(1,5)-arabinofuranosidase (non-reducing end)